MKLLIVEDDQELADLLKADLETRGHEATVARSGREGFEAATEGAFEAIVLDRVLPDLDGLGVVSLLRSEGVSTPVLILSVLSGVDQRVHGLEAGADDYLVKPFAFEELIARLIALARRPILGSTTTSLKAGDLVMDLIGRRVRRGDQSIELNVHEFRVLELLLRNQGHVVTRRMLLENVWGFHFDPKTNIVETQVSRLRTKVDRGHSQTMIHTLRGSGYMLSAPKPVL